MILKPLVFSGLLFAAALTALNAEDRPNIVWLMAEDIGQDLACYGMKGLQTPTLDQLAAEDASTTTPFAPILSALPIALL